MCCQLDRQAQKLSDHGAVQVTDLKLKISTAEQEREFYFNKLRDIEILCQLDEIKGQPVSSCAGCSGLSASSAGVLLHSAHPGWTGSTGDK